MSNLSRNFSLVCGTDIRTPKFPRFPPYPHQLVTSIGQVKAPTSTTSARIDLDLNDLDLDDLDLDDLDLDDLDLDDLDLNTSYIQNLETYAHLANMHTFQTQGEARSATISRDPLP